MSLILEALKKLERDRQTQDRGFLVLTQSAWRPAGERRWTRVAPLLAVAALAGGAIAVLLLRPAHTPPSAGAPPVSAPPVTAAAAPPAPLAARAVPAPTATPRPLVSWRWTRGNAATSPNDQFVAPQAPGARGTPAPVLRAPAASTAAPAAGPASETATEPTDADAQASETGIDPPAAAEPAPTPAAPLRLEAITQRDGQPIAVVNGQVVRVGDQIGASTVVRIGVSEIELETDGLRRTLRF